MWKERESPLRIEKRFEFDQYSKISKFMGEIEKLCKERDIYPNISFGKNFVSLSIFLDSKEISDKEKDFSKDIEKTVCWGHLETLNRCLPGRYKAPTYLMALIKRDIAKPNNY